MRPALKGELPWQKKKLLCNMGLKERRGGLYFFWPNSNRCTDAYVAIVEAENIANMEISTSKTIQVMHY